MDYNVLIGMDRNVLKLRVGTLFPYFYDTLGFFFSICIYFMIPTDCMYRAIFMFARIGA